LSAAVNLKELAHTRGFRLRPRCGLVSSVVLLAVTLSGCGDKPAPQAAAAPLPVTVAQPTKRTVTDWDEFTGRFEAVEEVQVRARVGGFVTNVEFKDGDMVHAGDLLYIIDPRPSRQWRPRQTAS
jgi:membrane fusion protein, multidrug efflux system